MTITRTWRGSVFIASSVDGFIARPDDDLDWLTDPAPGPQHARVESTRPTAGWDEFFPDVDHLVMGRGTYEKVLTFEDWPYVGKFVIVMSSALTTRDRRVTVVRSVAEAADLLAEAGARRVYVDGGKVIQSFLDADLIDDITIGWAPVLIGKGIPLFGTLPRDIQLQLEASNASEGGMVHASYTVHRTPSAVIVAEDLAPPAERHVRGHQE